jgi:hypothetical protein
MTGVIFAMACGYVAMYFIYAKKMWGNKELDLDALKEMSKVKRKETLIKVRGGELRCCDWCQSTPSDDPSSQQRILLGVSSPYLFISFLFPHATSSCPTQTAIAFGVVLALMFLAPVHNKDVSWIAVIGAILILVLVSPQHIHEIISKIEWEALIYQAALFVLIAFADELKLIK